MMNSCALAVWPRDDFLAGGIALGIGDVVMIVPLKRNGSCSTTPIWLRRSRRRILRTLTPSMSISPSFAS